MERIAAYPCPRCGYSPMYNTATYALQPGMVLKGKYMVGKVLGQGGFGITYIGMDLQLQRKVAIKEYYPAGLVGRKSGTTQVVWYASEAAREAMRSGQELVLKEARKMSKVSNIPSVVQVHNVFQENGTAYICMDFIEGQTLLHRLKQTGPLPWEQAKELFLPIIQAMGQVHQTGLIHRDLSPDNLMIQPDGRVKILDLGAAKDLNLNTGKSSMQVAKNGFSPLEQYLQSGSSGSWTDVYSMAATIYYTLTGIIPPSALDRMDNDAISWDLPQLQGLPVCVLAALKHALAVRPKDRIQTMEDFLKELQGEKKPVTRPKWLIPAAAAALAAVVIGAAAFTGLSPGKADPGTPAETGTSGYREQRPAASYSQWKDRVKELKDSCTAETFDYRNGARMTLYFDGQDNECLRIYTDEEGSEQYIILAEYDSQGNCLEQRCFEGQTLARSTVWTRNADGNVTQIVKTEGNGDLIEQTDIRYDSQGREESRKTVNGNGTVTSQGSSTYDSKGLETYSRTNDQGGHTVSLYDAESNILESTTTDAHGRQTSHTVYEYDRQGHNTAFLTYDETGELTYRSDYHFRGDVETGYTGHSYYNGSQYTYEYEYILGPRDIQFGQYNIDDDYSSYTEYVQDIIHGTNVLTFVYTEASYSTSVYDINHYNWSWDMISSEGYDAAGDLVEKSEALYDEAGNITGTLSYTYWDDGSYDVSESDTDYHTLYIKKFDASDRLLRSTEYRYDSNGERDGSVELEYGSDGSYTQTEMDRYFHTTASMTYDSTGALVSKAEYRYDSEGKKTRSILTVYYYDGSYTVTEKDGSNKTLSEKTYDRSGNLIQS